MADLMKVQGKKIKKVKESTKKVKKVPRWQERWEPQPVSAPHLIEIVFCAKLPDNFADKWILFIHSVFLCVVS